jgi:hypothetical protein
LDHDNDNKQRVENDFRPAPFHPNRLQERQKKESKYK